MPIAKARHHSKPPPSIVKVHVYAIAKSYALSHHQLHDKRKSALQGHFVNHDCDIYRPLRMAKTNQKKVTIVILSVAKNPGHNHRDKATHIRQTDTKLSASSTDDTIHTLVYTQDQDNCDTCVT